MKLDAVVVGAGFAGIYMLHRLREMGLSAKLIEAGSDVGGVWYWNRYPGVRCDVESIDYQYQFSDEIQRGWRWPERYSEGRVIQQYLAYVADTLHLRPDIIFDTRVEAANFDDTAGCWLVRTSRDEELSTRFLILATGPLTVTNIPDFPGLENFQGRLLHTARWPSEQIDFAGRDVAVIGTGSSGVQSIPVIARDAKSLTVFQRTAAYSIPAFNQIHSDDDIADAHARFSEDRQTRITSAGGMRWPLNTQSVFDVSPEEREAEFERRWRTGGFGFLLSYRDLLVSLDANEQAAEFVRRKIREKIRDPQTAEVLTPRSYPLGTKRPCLDVDYFETFNRPNVRLVDVRRDPIDRFSMAGIVAGGVEYAFDDIVLATGFDAMTGAVLGIELKGRGGVALKDLWADGPRSFLGIGVAGFPNLFMLDGPGSPSIIVNAPIVIEQQVDWIADCIAYMEAHDISTIEPEEEVQESWTQHVDEVANYTLYPRADSWGIGANIPGKPRVFMLYLGGLDTYRRKCDEVAANGYEGFRLDRETAAQT